MSSPISDHDLIRNTIARYSIGVDLKDWDLFTSAFTETAKITFPAPMGTFEGITTITATIQSTVSNFHTSHALSTQLIEITGEKTAKATTYTATELFGTGENEGKHATNRGLYRDKLVKISVDGREDWRIAERDAVGQWPLTGDLSLLAP
ncbi:SnoaL-like domain-containing protein [Plectosphaerella cucumerina]|uniref:SnoaL-like domain-containing protein n=1 Tax=Plectosphaerella cucumerina TaxID=40658 RepID=A0A8K0XAD7_9PEZI|nr:SnoaL-like domain-containing protein [Plectosphaerella cucumerina]